MRKIIRKNKRNALFGIKSKKISTIRTIQSKKSRGERQNCLIIKIEYKKLVPLYQFKDVLEGCHNQYNKHLLKSNIPLNDERLLIREIKKGSIEIVLISSAMLLMTEVNKIFTFFSHIKQVYTWLYTKEGEKPELDKEILNNTKNILAPVTGDDRSINFNIKGNNNTFNITYEAAKKINKNIDEELKALEVKDKVEPLPDSLIKEKVILVFTQVESSKKPNKSTKGKITEIDEKTHPILFETGLKQIMVFDTAFPLETRHLIDVKINIVNDQIDSYTVLNLIDSNYDEADNQSANALFSDNN